MSNFDLLDGRLKIRHLVLALEIQERGTVIGAANSLHITQPVVTRALRELEEILGIELFHRGPRGVSPTEAAEAFFHHAKSIVGHLNEVSDYLRELESGHTGELIVGTHLAGANALLPRTIMLLNNEAPNLKIQIRDGHPGLLLEELHEGKIHVVVSRAQPLNSNDELRQVRIHKEPFRLVCRAGHPALSQNIQSLSDLDAFPWILPAAKTYLRGEIETLFSDKDFHLSSAPVECSTPLTVISLLTQGDYIAVMPETIIHEHPRLRKIQLPLENLGQSIVATMNVASQGRPTIRRFLSALHRASRLLEILDS